MQVGRGEGGMRACVVSIHMAGWAMASRNLLPYTIPQYRIQGW